MIVLAIYLDQKEGGGESEIREEFDLRVVTPNDIFESRNRR